MSGNDQGALKRLQSKGPRRSQLTSNPSSRVGNASGFIIDRRRQDRAGNASGRALTRLSADDLEVPTFEDEEGRQVGIDLINRSRGGGAQNNIVADDGTGQGGVIGQTRTPALIAEEAARVKCKTGADSLVFKIQPCFKATNARLRRNGDIFVKASKLTAPSAPKLLKEPDRAAEIAGSEAGEPTCTNCKSSLHALDRCLYAPKGAIHGCPFCKNGTHRMEECNQFSAASISDIVKALVWDRPNMPPWNAKVPWSSYLTKYLSTEEFHGLAAQVGRQAVLAAPFPWTKNFARKFARGDDLARLQAELNDGITANLPADPKTGNIVESCKTYDVALELFWPEAVVESSVPDSTSTPAPVPAPAPEPAPVPAVASASSPASTPAQATDEGFDLDDLDFLVPADVPDELSELDKVTGALEKVDVSGAMALDQDRED